MTKSDQLQLKKENLNFINITSCRKNFINETGSIYGSLIVLGPVKVPNKTKTHWACQCKCGRIVLATGSQLRTNRITSCGHKCDKIEDLTNQTINFLTVLYKDPTNPRQFADNSIHWICRCNICGTVKSVSGRLIKNGQAKSCGCLKSSGQQWITQILNKMRIKYEKEYKFKDLKSDNNVCLRFDFALFKNQHLVGLIEYQGEQHYNNHHFFDTKESFEQRLDRDKKKYQYCLKHNIPLLIISSLQSNTKQAIEEKILNFIQENKL